MHYQELSIGELIEKFMKSHEEKKHYVSEEILLTSLLEIRDKIGKANEIIDRYVTEKLESDKVMIRLLEQINLRDEVLWSFGGGKREEDVVRIKSDLNNLCLRVNALEAKKS